MKEYFSLDKKQKKEILKKITSILKKDKKVVFAYSFGSFLDKKANFRNIDIGLYLKRRPKKTFDRE